MYCKKLLLKFIVMITIIFCLTATAGTDLYIKVINSSRYPVVLRQTSQYCMHNGKTGQWNGLKNILFPGSSHIGYLESTGGFFCTNNPSTVAFNVAYIENEAPQSAYSCGAAMFKGNTAVNCLPINTSRIKLENYFFSGKSGELFTMRLMNAIEY